MTTDGFVFPDPGVPTIPIERLELSSDKAARYVQQSRPFVARVDWPALAWTPESLRQAIGGSKVKLRKKTGEHVEVTVNDYIDVIDGMRSGTGEFAVINSPVIALRGPNANPDFEGLLGDLHLPAFVDPERVTEIYVWMKNIGWYDNRSHAEPNAAANLNLQVRGKKHVWLFPPDDAGLLGVASTREDMMGPPYFSAGQTVYAPSDEHPEFKDVRCYETVLEPGDMIFIPTFWYHWFVHYDAYQLNINTWFYTEQIPLSPVAAEWAYMKALGVALGGFEVAPERFAALPVETQELLAQIARTLINDRRTTDPRGNKSLFEKARQLQVDAKLLTK